MIAAPPPVRLAGRAVALAALLGGAGGAAAQAPPCVLGPDPASDVAHEAWSMACVDAILGADVTGRDKLLQAFLRSAYPLTDSHYTRLGERFAASAAAPLAVRAVFSNGLPGEAAPPPPTTLVREADRAGDDLSAAYFLLARAARTLEGYGEVGRRSLVGALSNQGAALGLMGEHEAAVPVFERSLVLGREEGRIDVEGYTTFHLAKSRYALGDRDAALAFADRGARLAGEHNDPAAAAPMWTWLAARRLDAGRTDAALDALDEARALMEVGEAGPQALLDGPDQGAWAHDYARGMAEVLARTDRPAQALDYALVALELGDRRLETERLQALADFEAVGDLRESEQQREIAAREAALAEARLDRQRAWLIGGGVGIALLVALAVSLYRTSRVRRRANALLTEKNAEIERQRTEVEAALARTERLLGEREVLLREVHHRVKNNLQIVASLVNLQSETVRDAAALAALRQMRSQVEALALVRRRLYGSDDLRAIGAADYLGELAALLESSYAWAAADVAVEAEVADVSLDADTAVPLGPAAAELVANALEHAFPAGGAGRVRLALEETGARLRLVVEDDGAGLPPGLAAPPGGSLGLQLASDLAVQLGGRFEMGRSAALGGARFALDVPRPAPPDGEPDAGGAAVGSDGAAGPVPEVA